ncbi:MAG: carbohydrate binding domain-containing protein [Tepidisphaeraceae bacterium]|jgi:predicted small secreted protein
MNRYTRFALLIGLAIALPLWAAENLLKSANKTDSWRLETHEGAKAKMEIDGDAMVFTVTDADGTDWHAQAIQTGIDLKNDGKYKLSFEAKAEPAADIPVNAGIDVEDWHMVGLTETAQLGKEWKKVEYEFTATDVKANKNRIAFVLGGNKGKVWIKDCVLTAK